MKRLFRSKKATIIELVVIAILLILLLLPRFITDYYWFDSLGYNNVFWKEWVTKAILGVPIFLLVFLVSNVCLRALKFQFIDSGKIIDDVRKRLVKRAELFITFVYSIGITVFAIGQLWFKFLKFSHAKSFSIKDPFFGLDISFFAFKLDFLKSLASIILVAMLFIAVLIVIHYVILIAVEAGSSTRSDYIHSASEIFGNMGHKFKERVNIQSLDDDYQSHSSDDPKIKELIHFSKGPLIIVGALFFVMLSLDFFLRQFELLYSSRGVVYGAGYTDVHVTLWMYRILSLLSLVAAFTFGFGLKRGSFKKAIKLPVALIVIFIVGNISAALVQALVVAPGEISKESKYLKRNIQYTQKAYALDKVQTKQFSASSKLTSDDIKNNQSTIKNIRINDFETAQTFYNQTQAIRQYYTFPDVNVDRYNIGGKYTQTFIASREIDESKITDTWVNKNLKYTHGYGATLSRVDKVTDNGQPDLLLKNIPPETDEKEIKIKRPEIYFGKKTNEYSLVNTLEEEFDYPDGDKNKYCKYKGKAGIKLNPFKRALFALRQKSVKLMVSGSVTSKSKIIINKNIEKRVKEIMPFLEYDKSPYIVISEGRLFWIIDAYTTNNRYPYSEPYDAKSGNNYIRNSVKVVVDAYNGDTTYYAMDKDDPVLETYRGIYPTLFKDGDKMPGALKKHIRYPNKLFKIQADIYRRYHMNSPSVFYQNEDVWDIAEQIFGTRETKMKPTYYILRLPGEKKEEFVNTLPYTPKHKKNMTGLLVARNDNGNYGKLVLYKLPKNKLIYGPAQIEAQIDQNTEISKEFSLWNSSGSTYTRGDMFVIPIENSLMYVEPVYLESTNSAIPEVKRVIAVYDNKIAYKKTLSEAMSALFGSSLEKQEAASTKPGAKSKDGDKDSKKLGEEANEIFKKALSAQKDGDWAEYGRLQKKLQKILAKLAR